MNTNQFWSVARFVLSFGGGILSTFGFLTTEQLAQATVYLTQIVGPLSALAALIWGIYTHTTASTVRSAADIVPIPAALQHQAGVVDPIHVPSNPPAASIAR